MAYVSLYRKWRPRTFEEVVGQEHITRTICNSIRLGRVSHAYLFCGPRGTGKTTVAKLLAKALNCKEGPTPDPCDQCESCTRIREGYSVDVVEIDGASNRGIDEVRDLRERVKLLPTEGKYRIYIIDEVHMLTTEAFNALLKTLEEPPAHVVFVFATTEPQRILPTILSRCQRFDFRRLTSTEVMKRLKEVAEAEGITAEEEALHLLAKKGEGSMRDSLGLLEQCVAFEGSTLTYEGAVSLLGVSRVEELLEFANTVAAGDLAGALEFVDRIIFSGKDPSQFLKDIAEHYRNLLVIKECQGKSDLVDATESWKSFLEKQASSLKTADIIRMLEQILVCESSMRRASNPQVTLEVLAANLARPDAGTDLAALTERVRALERQVTRIVRGVPAAAATEPPRNEPPRNEPPRSEPAAVPPSPSARAASSAAIPATSDAADTAAGTASDAVSGNSPADVNSVNSWWPAVMEEVKAAKRTVHTLLLLTRPLGVQGEVLTLGSDRRWAVERLGTKPNREVIERAVQKVVGMPLRVKCEYSGEATHEETGTGDADDDSHAAPDAGGAGSAREPDSLQDEIGEPEEPGDDADVYVRETLERMRRIESEPIIKDVLSLFGGRVLKVE